MGDDDNHDGRNTRHKKCGNSSSFGSHRFTAQKIFLRSTMSASAPAGNVNSANGRAESVDISEIRKAESPIVPKTEKAAVLWAARQVPETRVASWSLEAYFRERKKLLEMAGHSLITS
jgi:hypothetical protein